MADITVTNNDARGPERLALSVEEAARRLSVSPSFLRLEIGRGRLRPVRLGRRVLITESEIQRYLATHALEEKQAPGSGKGGSSGD